MSDQCPGPVVCSGPSPGDLGEVVRVKQSVTHKNRFSFRKGGGEVEGKRGCGMGDGWEGGGWKLLPRLPRRKTSADSLHLTEPPQCERRCARPGSARPAVCTQGPREQPCPATPHAAPGPHRGREVEGGPPGSAQGPLCQNTAITENQQTELPECRPQGQHRVPGSNRKDAAVRRCSRKLHMHRREPPSRPQGV